MDFDSDISGYEWDDDKYFENFDDHGVWFEEAAEAVADAAESGRVERANPKGGEIRWIALGHSSRRPLRVVFTMRGTVARIISAKRRH